MKTAGTVKVFFRCPCCDEIFSEQDLAEQNPSIMGLQIITENDVVNMMKEEVENATYQ